MAEQRTYDIEAALCGASNTAALMRLLAVLHVRADEVLDLCFDGAHPGGALVTGRVTLTRAAPEALQSWLQRSVDVMEARVRRAVPASAR
jgi:hypothetical protein